MIELTTARDIDRIVYNDFIYNQPWINILDMLSVSCIETIIDIGASSGISSLWLLGKLPNVKTIYCFEPDLENYNMLLINLSKFEDKIVPHNLGIYYGMESSKVYGIGDNSPLGYCVQTIKDRTVTEHVFTEYEGKVFKLAELESIVNFPVDLIKVDIEGSEYNVIENSTILKQARYLLLSFHNQYESYVQDFIKTHLNNYEIIFFGGSGVYFDVFLERK